jgi:hypothetical protein
MKSDAASVVERWTQHLTSLLNSSSGIRRSVPHVQRFLQRSQDLPAVVPVESHHQNRPAAQVGSSCPFSQVTPKLRSSDMQRSTFLIVLCFLPCGG